MSLIQRAKGTFAMTDEILFSDFEIKEDDLNNKLEFNTNGNNIMVFDTSKTVEIFGNTKMNQDLNITKTGIAGLVISGSTGSVIKTKANSKDGFTLSQINGLSDLFLGVSDNYTNYMIMQKDSLTLGSGVNNFTMNTGTAQLADLNVVGGNITGTLDTAAQPNITSLGTLTSLTSTGNISGSTLTGTLQTASQPNITSVGTLNDLTINGNTVEPLLSLGDGTGASTDLLKFDTERAWKFRQGGTGGSGATLDLVSEVTGKSFNIMDEASSNIVFKADINGTASSQRIVMCQAGGKVGIGGVPSVELDVVGDCDISGTLTATNISGTLTTANQSNITTVGKLGSLEVGGSTANILVKGNNSSIEASIQLARASATSYQITNDTGNFEISQYADGVGTLTDFYRYAANSHRFSTSGLERMRVDSGGVDVTGSIDITGDYKKNGSIINFPIINKVTYNSSDLGLSDLTYSSGTGWNVIATRSFTKDITASDILVQYDCDYELSGTAADTIGARIVVNGVARTTKFQRFLNASGGGSRSGPILPISSTTSSLSSGTYTITVEVQRTSTDDTLKINRTNGACMIISEVAQ